MVTVFIADDHAVVRKGLKAILDSDTDFTIVGEAEDGLQALSEVERLRPDILVVDIMMPGLGGLEVTRQIHQVVPQTRIVVLSLHDNEPYVIEALRHGASAYLIKSSSVDHILVALHEVMKGHRYLSPPLTERAIQVYISRAGEDDHAIDRYETLTSRERQVLHLAAESLTNTEIGERLNISPRTAETHRTNLMRKLTLRTHSDLLRYAMRRGIIASA